MPTEWSVMSLIDRSPYSATANKLEKIFPAKQIFSNFSTAVFIFYVALLSII